MCCWRRWGFWCRVGGGFSPCRRRGRGRGRRGRVGRGAGGGGGRRRGWGGWGGWGGAGKGLAAAGPHEGGELGGRAGDAGLVEPKVAPVLAGMRWDRMLAVLEKMPQADFERLVVGASGILQPVMGRAPV